jgi:hypothetical protein
LSILGVQYYLSYGLAFALGTIILLVSSFEKFDKPYPGNKYLTELLPSSLTPGSSYIKAFLIYFTIIVGFYAAACVFSSTATGLWDVVLGEGAGKKFTGEPASPPVAAKPATSDPKTPPSAPAEIPLVIALLMVGLFPKYKQFGEIEAPLRRFAHRLIGIPQGLEEQAAEITVTALAAGQEPDERDRATVVRLFLGHRLAQMPASVRAKLANDLRVAEFGAVRDEDKGKELTEQDKEAARILLEESQPALAVAEKWYRARRLVNRIHQDRGANRRVADLAARTKYEKLRNDLKNNYDEIAAEFARIGSEQRKLTELVETLESLRDSGAVSDDAAEAGEAEAISSSDLTEVVDSLQTLMQKRSEELTAAEKRIDDVLGKAHLYIAAALLLKSPKIDEAQFMDAYGLEKPETVVRAAPIDDLLLAILVMVGALFMFNYILYWLLYTFNLTDKNPNLTALRLVVSALLMHGGAAIMAFSWHRRWVKAHAQTGGKETPKLPVRGHLELGAIVYALVYAGLLLWSFVLTTLNPEKMKEAGQLFSFLSDVDLAVAYAVLSLSAVATAICTVVYIEYVERSELTRKSIVVRALIQGTITAFIVLVSSQIQDSNDLYFVVTSSLNGFVVGATLGAAVLKLAAKRRQSSQLPTVLLPAPAVS